MPQSPRPAPRPTPRHAARRGLLCAGLLVAGCNGDSAGAADMATADLAPKGGPTLDPGTISASRKSSAEAETHVAAGPNGFVAAAWIALLAGGASTNGYAFSRDDGATWEAPQTIASPGGRVSSDPVLAVDAEGTFYLTWIGYRIGGPSPSDMHVYVARAPAGTTTFGETREVTDAMVGDTFDKPWITVLGDGAVLITYAKTSTGGIYTARSYDFTTWDINVIVEGQAFRNLVFPCQGAGSERLYVTYHAGGGIGLRWSEDGGVTWNDADRSSVAGVEDSHPPAFDDPTCAVAGDEVWVSYGRSTDTFSTAASAKLFAVRVAHSTDRGVTFSEADAADSEAAPFFMHPYLLREPGGALDLVYYAGSSEGDAGGTFRRTRSTDGGATWARSAVVREPITYQGARDNGKWFGDYVGLSWARGNLYISYADNSGPLTHVNFHRVAP